MYMRLQWYRGFYSQVCTHCDMQPQASGNTGINGNKCTVQQRCTTVYGKLTLLACCKVNDRNRICMPGWLVPAQAWHRARCSVQDVSIDGLGCLDPSLQTLAPCTRRPGSATSMPPAPLCPPGTGLQWVAPVSVLWTHAVATQSGPPAMPRLSQSTTTPKPCAPGSSVVRQTCAPTRGTPAARWPTGPPSVPAQQGAQPIHIVSQSATSVLVVCHPVSALIHGTAGGTPQWQTPAGGASWTPASTGAAS
jgi:hypothetical protein